MSILLSYLVEKQLIQLDKPLVTSDIVLWKRQLPTILYHSHQSEFVDETQQHMTLALKSRVQDLQILNKILTDDIFTVMDNEADAQWCHFVEIIIKQQKNIGCLPTVTSFTGESKYFLNFCPNKNLTEYYNFLVNARNINVDASSLELYQYKRARIWSREAKLTKECVSDLCVVRRDRFRCVQDWLQYLQVLIGPRNDQADIYCLQWSHQNLEPFMSQWIKTLMQCIEITSRTVYVTTLFSDHANLVICDNKQNRVLFYVSNIEQQLLLQFDIQLHLNKPIQYFVLETNVGMCKRLCHIVASHHMQIAEHQPDLLETIWQQSLNHVDTINDIAVRPHVDADHLVNIFADQYPLQDPQQAILEHYTMEAFVDLVDITNHSDLIRHISYYVANRLIFHTEPDLFTYLDLCTRRLQIQGIKLHTWNLYDLIAFAHHKIRHVTPNRHKSTDPSGLDEKQ